MASKHTAACSTSPISLLLFWYLLFFCTGGVPCRNTSFPKATNFTCSDSLKPVLPPLPPILAFLAVVVVVVAEAEAAVFVVAGVVIVLGVLLPYVLSFFHLFGPLHRLTVGIFFLYLIPQALHSD